MKQKFKWGTIIPLIGGASIGAYQATGVKPEFIFSYPPFAPNDQYLRNYWPDVPYVTLDIATNALAEGQTMPDVSDTDFVLAVPPCAGLSQLNRGGSGRPELKRGSCAAQNQWMYKSAKFALETIKPNVFFAENAPALFGPIGEGVVECLKEIAKENGYSLSIIKTNTRHHGVPQNRPRTFFFMWNTKTAPMFDTDNLPELPSLAAYLDQVPADATYHEVDKYRDMLQNDTIYRYLNTVLFPNNWRSIAQQGYKTMLQYLSDDQDRLLEAAKWVEQQGDDRRARKLRHVHGKKAKGMGAWDFSVRLPDHEVVAIIRRNMYKMVHPTEERILTLREHMHLMGLPHDFQLYSTDHKEHIGQNVPVMTAKFAAEQAVKFCLGQLKDSGEFYFKQSILDEFKPKRKPETIEGFF